MMNFILTIDSNELTEFIKAVQNGIEESQKNGKFELITPIDFELSVIVKKEGKGGVNIAIVGAGGKYEKESASIIKFSMGNPLSLESIEKMLQLYKINSQISNENMASISKLLKADGRIID